MKKTGQRWVVFVGVLAMVLGLLLPVARNAAAQAQDVLKFGSLVPIMTKEGVEIKKWNDLFAKMANEKGGLAVGGKKYKVEFFTYDVAYDDAAKTLAAVQKAIHQDGVKYLVDIFGDHYVLTAVHADQNKVIDMGIGFGDETVGTKHQYFFRPLGGYFTAASNYLISRDFVKKGAKTSLVCTIDSEMGHVVAAQYGAADAMAGLKLIPPVFFGMDTVDYGPIATKVKSLNPDVVDFGAAIGDQIVNLVGALKDAGWKGFIFPGAAINPTTYANIIKRVGSYFDGSEMFYNDPRGIPIVAKDPEMKELIDRYIERIRRVPHGRLPVAHRLVYGEGCDVRHEERRPCRTQGLSRQGAEAAIDLERLFSALRQARYQPVPDNGRRSGERPRRREERKAGIRRPDHHQRPVHRDDQVAQDGGYLSEILGPIRQAEVPQRAERARFL